MKETSILFFVLVLALATRFSWPPKVALGIIAAALYAVWILRYLPHQRRLLLIPSIVVAGLLATPYPSLIIESFPVGMKLLILLVAATLVYAVAALAVRRSKAFTTSSDQKTDA